jgi:ankyrin repeat protein
MRDGQHCIMRQRGGHKDTVMALLDHGTDVNSQNNTGWTALHHPTWGGYKDVVMTLLDCGADLNAHVLPPAPSSGHKEWEIRNQLHPGKVARLFLH